MDALIICIFKGMHWKRYRPWLIPLLIVTVIKIFSFFPEAVEKYYSTGIYPVISIFPRLVFGRIPFAYLVDKDSVFYEIGAFAGYEMYEEYGGCPYYYGFISPLIYFGG